MKKILIVLGAVVALVVVALAASVFLTRTAFRVEREIEIDKPKSEVFAYLKVLKNQNDWGPWVKKDPNIKLSYEGTDGEVGFISKWDSKSEEVGTGEQEIIKIAEGERIDYELRFKSPFEATNDAWLTTEEVTPDKTKVSWGFSGELARPFNLMLVLTDFEGIVGKDFEEGLASLKKIVEEQESPAPEKEEPDRVKTDAEKTGS